MISYKNMRAFVEVAKSNTFAEAAQKLFLSQPALSSAIKNMESQLGGQLFIRSTRRVELSPEGKLFLPKAQRVLIDYEGAIDDVKALFTAQQGSIVVSAMPSFASGPLPQILQTFTQQFSNISIRILDVVMEKVIDNVKQQRAELGFVFTPPALEGLSFQPLMSDSFCVVMPQFHPLAKKESCRLQEIAEFPFVAMNRESSIRKWLDTAMAQANISLKIITEASQLSTIGQLVASNIGISIVPQLCKHEMQNKGLVCLNVSDLAFNKQIGVIYRKQDSLSVAAQQLLLVLEQKGNATL
ncbi:LysR family transcriptional regulator [Glaciecola sp. 2405UD65-10]|uniref:LysR family transcriptional regulator n=1 Tax=Glaciecola sp. 2405UD65-10 TaxID=3397244 RepID=UPI003B597A88